VREAWIVAPQRRTVEVLQLSPERIERLGLYGLGDLIVSQVLSEPQLTVGGLCGGGEPTPMGPGRAAWVACAQSICWP
jgi:hypothetical protein